MPDLCMTTDYASSTRPAGPYLRRMAEAGFSHVHWCHHWNKARRYGDEEIEALRSLLAELRLRVLDLHALVRDRLFYVKARRSARQKGLELVVSRIRMAARLGADTVILHPPQPKDRDCGRVWDGARRFIDSLLEAARPLGVRLAFENLAARGTWEMLERLLAHYDAAAVGLCYDSGHGNMVPGSLEALDKLRGRLFSVHLHDNDGSADQHRLPFTGTVDWARLSSILADSSYDRPISLESNARLSGAEAEAAYLRQAHAAAGRIATMVAGRRAGR
jgi:sugar phosphate isomerase/epimerase